MTAAIFDYGSGNLHSLASSLARAGAQVLIETDPERALVADALVLPGAGAYGAAANRLAPFAPAMRAALASGHPCLGIGLGMHLLFETSEEGEGAGIAALRGRVRKLRSRRVPQVGWNDVVPAEDDLFHSLPPFLGYFDNSYVAEPTDPASVVGTTQFEHESFAAAVRRDLTWGVQFRPEKSGPAGLHLLRNFLTAAQRHV